LIKHERSAAASHEFFPIAVDASGKPQPKTPGGKGRKIGSLAHETRNQSGMFSKIKKETNKE
jgi:hypothetical protein